MKKIIALLSATNLSKIALILFTTGTVFLSTTGVIKASQGFRMESKKVPEVKELPETKQTKPEATKESVTVGVNGSGNASLVANRPQPTVAPRPTSAPAPAANDNRCLITLWGQQYDVTSLQNSHSGGNVFNCGTDMTATYQSQHGTNLSRMQPYLVTAAGGANTGSSGTSNSSGSVSREREIEEEHENESERERQEMERAFEEEKKEMENED